MTIPVIRPTLKGVRVGGKSTSKLRYIVLDTENNWLKQPGKSEAVVCNSGESIRKALTRINADTLWISTDSEHTEKLVKTLVGSISETTWHRASFGDFLALEPAKVEIRSTLEGLFSRVIGVAPGFKTLPLDELLEVLGTRPLERRDLLIGGVLNAELGTLVLVRGNLERVMVPLSLFRPSGTATPDFGKFELGDFGHTLRFGMYEATADSVLWEVDPDFRKRAKAKEHLHATGFGSSLRRLRKQRGLSQSDFPKVARKTISRIENGEVDRPHGVTLNRIAKALGVAADEIESY
jgi:DNA-binding XRE family transcriptional regulator